MNPDTPENCSQHRTKKAVRAANQWMRANRVKIWFREHCATIKTMSGKETEAPNSHAFAKALTPYPHADVELLSLSDFWHLCASNAHIEALTGGFRLKLSLGRGWSPIFKTLKAVVAHAVRGTEPSQIDKEFKENLKTLGAKLDESYKSAMASHISIGATDGLRECVATREGVRSTPLTEGEEVSHWRQMKPSQIDKEFKENLKIRRDKVLESLALNPNDVATGRELDDLAANYGLVRRGLETDQSFRGRVKEVECFVRDASAACGMSEEEILRDIASANRGEMPPLKGTLADLATKTPFDLKTLEATVDRIKGGSKDGDTNTDIVAGIRNAMDSCVREPFPWLEGSLGRHVDAGPADLELRRLEGQRARRELSEETRRIHRRKEREAAYGPPGPSDGDICGELASMVSVPGIWEGCRIKGRSGFDTMVVHPRIKCLHMYLETSPRIASMLVRDDAPGEAGELRREGLKIEWRAVDSDSTFAVEPGEVECFRQLLKNPIVLAMLYAFGLEVRK